MSQANPFLPYSRPFLNEDDIEAVVAALQSPMISQGERIRAFERAFAGYAGVPHAVGFSSGTAALHGAVLAAGIEPGDEVIVPPLTFAATANVVRYCGATPVFADIEAASRCIDPVQAEAAITDRTRALVAVDFAGHPADYDRLRALADTYGLTLIGDAAHSAGATYKGRPIATCTDLSAFSFNPVKNMTSAEGGMLTTSDQALFERGQMAGLHGMTRNPDLLERSSPGGWYYEQQFLGFNYKLSELHAALGMSQLSRLDGFNQRRRQLAQFYDDALAGLPLQLPRESPDVQSAWHLYVVLVQDESPLNRAQLFAELRQRGLGVQVHYVPVVLHPDYERLGHRLADYPVVEAYYQRAISLPLHPAMTGQDAERVVDTLSDLLV
ncbi:MAG: UDP-4-amino-4,6-dideoxy-N-acetyl-beta-L-altrosamine transaminase [Bacteroidota bacterium]